MKTRLSNTNSRRLYGNVSSREGNITAPCVSSFFTVVWEKEKEESKRVRESVGEEREK